MKMFKLFQRESVMGAYNYNDGVKEDLIGTMRTLDRQVAYSSWAKSMLESQERLKY